MKVCKGTGKAIGYGCGKPEPIMKYGLCKACFKDWILNTEDGQQMLKRAQLRGRKEIKKKASEWRKNKEREIETKSDLEKKLQPLINAIVREIDKAKGCISCDHGWTSPFTRQAHAGHRLSVGAAPHLRFNVHNIYKQCSICNNWKSSNERGYDSGLKEHYGEETFEYVKSLRSTCKDVRWDKADLRDAITKAKDVLKRIKAGEVMSREEINKIIGLYL